MKYDNKINGSIGRGFSVLPLKNTLNEIKNSKVVRNITIYSVAAAIALSMTACGSKDEDKELSYDEIIDSLLNDENIKLISEYNISKITLNKSDSLIQKETLNNCMDFLADYNIRYGFERMEIVDVDGEKVRIQPALTWNEVFSMSLFYNDFGKEDIQQIINGSEISAYDLSQSYNMAILQLMGGHIIESEKSQIDASILLHTKEAKKFYNKYHKMFIECKLSEGEEQISAVEKFYQEIAKDFPINDYQREEGISHSEPRELIKNYKFSIVPMVAASEMLFQNLEYDHTMSQKVIDYFNDIGACNLANDVFDRVEVISLFTEKNDKFADYEQVRDYVIEYLKDMKSYSVDDLSRELTLLTRFKIELNTNLTKEDKKGNDGSYITKEYYTEKDEYTTTDREDAVEHSSEEEVQEAEKEGQEEIDKENAQAEEEAEKEADKNASDMQAEEDKKGEQLEEEANKNNSDTQQDIEDANTGLNNGDTVNKDDLGPNVHIDDEYLDENGNIDSSIGGITTDGSNLNEVLPDPNASDSFEEEEYETLPDPNGADDFEEEEYTPKEVSETLPDPNAADDFIEDEYCYEYEEEYVSNEEIADQYISALVNSKNTNENGYSKVLTM